MRALTLPKHMKTGRYKVTSAPASEPVSRADMKEHLRVSHTDDDDYIDALIEGARTFIERQFDVGIITQTITEVYDDWDEPLRLSISPVASITSLSYYDADNSLQAVSSSNFILDSYGPRSVIEFDPDYNQPTLYDRRGAVVVVYVAGAATAATPLAHAMKLLVGDWYVNRERMGGNLKIRYIDTVERLIHPYLAHHV